MFKFGTKFNGLEEVILFIGSNEGVCLIEKGDHLIQHYLFIFLILADKFVFTSSPVETQLANIKNFENGFIFVLKLGPIKEFLLPKTIGGVNLDLIESDSHWKLTLEVLIIF